VLSEASDRAMTAIAGRAFSVAPSESMKESVLNGRSTGSNARSLTPDSVSVSVSEMYRCASGSSGDVIAVIVFTFALIFQALVFFGVIYIVWMAVTVLQRAYTKGGEKDESGDE
jgi:hypothetical protein